MKLNTSKLASAGALLALLALSPITQANLPVMTLNLSIAADDAANAAKSKASDKPQAILINGPDALAKARKLDKALAPAEHVRREDQTLLTIPEWFLVHSPNEYADFIKTERPSRFPFWGHIRQFWSTYAAVYRETKDRYDFNLGYHVMVMTIGVSTTLEYAVKGAYEAVVGNLFEGDGKHYRTEEDAYAAKIAREYVDFIVVDPWYKFDFMKAVRGLWNDVPGKGSNQWRKWERRYALTSEYLAKAGYAWVIKQATQASFEAPKQVTAAVVTFPDHLAAQQVPGLKVLQKLGPYRYVVTLPRYQAFTKSAVAVARAGGRFEEVAGNRDFIVYSVLAPKGFDAKKIKADVVLEQPILTDSDRKRIVYRSLIKDLSENLSSSKRAKQKIEHIYDF